MCIFIAKADDPDYTLRAPCQQVSARRTGAEVSISGTKSRHTVRRSFSLIIVFASTLVLNPLLTREARADEPLTTAFVVGVASSIAAAAIWDYFHPAPPPPQPVIQIQINGNDHNTININSTTNPAPISPTTPNQTVRVPNDLSPIPVLPPGTSITGALNVNGSSNSVGTTLSNVTTAGSLTAGGFDSMALSLVARNSITFTRPLDASGQPATFNLGLNLGGLTFQTINLPSTTARTGWTIDVSSPEFGTLFHSAASLAQGSLTPVIEGAIPSSAFVVSSPGNMSLTSFVTNQALNVPLNLDAFTINIRVESDSVAAAVPEPQTFILLTTGIAVLGGMRFRTITRRRIQGSRNSDFIMNV